MATSVFITKVCGIKFDGENGELWAKATLSEVCWPAMSQVLATLLKFFNRWNVRSGMLC